MRFVRIDVDGSRIDFHPKMTVISGLDPFAKERLVHDLSALCQGDITESTVLMEAYGIVLRGDNAERDFLSLKGGVDTVVRIPDLLPSDDEEMESDLDSQIALARAAVETIATRVAELKGANHQLESANLSARNLRDEALGKIRELQAAVAGRHVEPLAAALAGLAEYEQACNLPPGHGLATSQTAPEQRMNALQSVLALLHDRLDTNARLQRDALLTAAREVHATRVIGPDAPPEQVERAQRACREMYQQLQTVGVTAETLDPNDLLRLAKGWVDEFATKAETPRELLQALQNCQSERSRMAAEIALHETGGAIYDPGAQVLVDAVEAAVAEFDRYLANAVRLLDSMDDLHSAELELGQSGPQYGAVVQEIRHAERELMIRQSELDRLTAPKRAQVKARNDNTERSGDPVLQVATRLNNRATTLRATRLAGSLPMIIDQALDVIPNELLGFTLDTLVKISEVVQVIVISDNVEVANFARIYGIDKILYVDQALSAV